MLDGLGVVQTFASPAAGAGFSTTVPVGVRWRIWGGSALLVTSSTAANRNPFLTCKSDTTFLWAGGQTSLTLGTVPDYSITASQSTTIVFHEQQAELNDWYVNAYFPIPCKAIWLPTGTVVALTVQNMKPSDQLSTIGLLIEEVTL